MRYKNTVAIYGQINRSPGPHNCKPVNGKSL